MIGEIIINIITISPQEFEKKRLLCNWLFNNNKRSGEKENKSEE
jgi:hypothetical protein